MKYGKGDLASFVMSELTRFGNARTELEETWLEAWSLYLNTNQSIDYIRGKVLQTVGDVNDDWRHKINTGKAFEVVETIHSYLMSAFFPNEDWFEVSPTLPGEDNHTLARVVKKYIQNKLEVSGFQSEFANFLRQLIITGTSVLALPWRQDLIVENEIREAEIKIFDEFGVPEWEVVSKEALISRPEFETLDNFDVYVDPSAIDPNEASIIRRLRKTKAEVLRLVEDGTYEGITAEDIKNMEPSRFSMSYDAQTLETMSGYTISEMHYHEIEIIEFWGDLIDGDEVYEDYVATVIDGRLVSCIPNPFWKKPFIVGSYIRVPRQPYGVGALQPNLGMLHQLNIITNQRLDSMEIHVNKMWTAVDDGVIDMDDIESKPGKILAVGSHDSLQPVDMGDADFTVSYTEAQVLEAIIDKNAGTGNYVGANAQRSGERVTAAEIAAVRDAGGNRLSGVHKHIEQTSLKNILTRLFYFMRQFVREDEIVRIAGNATGEFKYYSVGVEQLNKPLTLKPLGAGHVIERKKYIQDRLDFIASVSQIPEMAQLIDFSQILHDLLINWGFDEPEKYLKVEEAPTEAGVSQQTDIIADAENAGGQALKNVVEANINADGGLGMMQELFPMPENIKPEDMPIGGQIA